MTVIFSHYCCYCYYYVGFPHVHYFPIKASPDDRTASTVGHLPVDGHEEQQPHMVEQIIFSRIRTQLPAALAT